MLVMIYLWPDSPPLYALPRCTEWLAKEPKCRREGGHLQFAGVYRYIERSNSMYIYKTSRVEKAYIASTCINSWLLYSTSFPHWNKLYIWTLAISNEFPRLTFTGENMLVRWGSSSKTSTRTGRSSGTLRNQIRPLRSLRGPNPKSAGEL